MNADENGFFFYCSYVPYSQPVTIIFHCIAQEEANGHESVNAATVKAANTDERSDDAEVYVNSGEFWIEKSADHYEWQVGEQVQYNVVVENKKAGTVARNVTVWGYRYAGRTCAFIGRGCIGKRNPTEYYAADSRDQRCFEPAQSGIL